MKAKPKQKVGEFNNKNLEAAISDFLSIFGGEDGGISYYKLCMGFKNIESQYEKDSSESARQLIELTIRFHKLMKLLIGDNK